MIVSKGSGTMIIHGDFTEVQNGRMGRFPSVSGSDLKKQRMLTNMMEGAGLANQRRGYMPLRTEVL